MVWSGCRGGGPALTSQGDSTSLAHLPSSLPTLPFVLLVQDQLDELHWGPRPAAQLLLSFTDPISKGVTIRGRKAEGTA